jgi:hypothetical protein
MDLHVKAVGTALVPDYAALDAGILRFIGKRHDASHGVNGAWIGTDETVTIPMRAEYVQEVKAGVLVPCDAETARACGVPFTAPSKVKADTK